MSLIIQQSEATAAQRRVHLQLVDATDGITAETGEGSGQPQVSKNGAAFANTSATLTHIANGWYYVELSATEVDTVGPIVVRYKSANTTERGVVCQVVPFDPYDTVRLGLTALPNAVAAASGGLITFGTSTGQLNVDGSGNGYADVREWLGTAPNALTSSRVDVSVGAIAANAITATAINTGAITAAKFAAGAIDAASLATDAVAEIVDAVWDEDIVAAHSTADTAGLILSQLTKRSVTWATAVVSGSMLDQLADDGTASYDRTTDSLQAQRDSVSSSISISGTVSDAGATATDFDVAGSGISSSDDVYNTCKLAFTSGVNKGISRTIVDFVGASKNCQFTGNVFPAAPANGDSFEIYGG